MRRLTTRQDAGMNDEGRQVEIAAEVETAARHLAHSTRRIPNPADSYRLLGELNATVDHLAQIADQLAHWHEQTTEGAEHSGANEAGDGTGPSRAAKALRQAAMTLAAASTQLATAHSANGVVRWTERAVAEKRGAEG